jgi:xylan 1,4-beta-xylosidase
MQELIHNPILPGFHPDPSAIRVGDTYYVAVSTFEWYPGVEIFASKNLRDWKSVARPLDTLDMLDMRGEEASGGIWAPNLSWHDGLFHLVYTDMKSGRAPIKDLDNYLITAPDITGPWSERIFLNSTGFDPALFHDDDGKKYLINMVVDFRPGHNRFGGIQLQEYDPEAKRLIGEAHLIDKPRGLREGSNLYKIDGWYYLMIAEGGTGVEHSTVLSRSKSILGPYTDDPDHFLMTSRFAPFHPIQRAGHSSLIETPEGEWYLLHLASRPLSSTGRCVLGRECFLQKLDRTKDGWFRLVQGGVLPATDVEPPFPIEPEQKQVRWDYTFDGKLPDDFFTLREPADPSLFDFSTKKGTLCLHGRHSLFSTYGQALAARRISHFFCTVTTHMTYTSGEFHKAAGLVALYDQENFFYLERSWDEEMGEVLLIAGCDNGTYTETDKTSYQREEIWLRMELSANKLQFLCSEDGKSYRTVGEKRDASILSDEHCRIGRFTGAMVGICAQDLTGSFHSADFDSFTYEAQPS